jgi:uncharacterized protein YycO
MRHLANIKAGPLGVVIAALLVPGGSLLLAWALYRRFARPEAGASGIQRWIPLVTLAALLQGCATHLSFRPETVSRDGETPAEAAVLKFQRSSIEPGSEEALLHPEDLRPGDILLTHASSLRAAGIQLFTLAPVSHAALYIGEGRIAEAVMPSVRTRSIDDVLKEEEVVVVLRHSDLTEEQARLITEYALNKSGTGFSFLGVTLQFPFSIARRACEVPLMPSAVRDACMRSLGVVSQVAASERQLFCSQLVLQAYRHAGVTITSADPRLVSPADILHMREGDVSSFSIRKQLRYVGLLKYEQPFTVAFQQ